MPYKKLDQDPFSNGSEHSYFEEYNCLLCWKHSHLRLHKQGNGGYVEYTQIICSIERDIITRMSSNEPIKKKTIDICHDFLSRRQLCPYRQTRRKYRPKKQPKNQTQIILDYATTDNSNN